MGVLLPRVQCKCFFSLQQIVHCIYVACTSVASASFSSPPISTLCSDQTKTKTTEIKLSPIPGLVLMGPSHLMLTSRKWHLSWVLFNLMWLMSFAVLPHYLIIKPNSYLAFWSWSAENLMPLPMITPFVMPCSKYRRDIIKLWDAIEQSYILRSSHREHKVNKNHWVLNVSAFCQRKFCVRLYFQRAENVFVGRSLNPNQLCCQNTIKTIWSPLLPPSTITVPF